MPCERALEPNYSVKRRSRGVDRAIAALADGQHGVVARGQLLPLGLERHAIGYRLEIGRLHPVYMPNAVTRDLKEILLSSPAAVPSA